MLKRITKLFFYLLVFLLPLFWLPITSEYLEFNKQYLLFVLVCLIFLAWLYKQVISDKRLMIKRTPLDIFIFVFMILMILSAVFSVDKVSSLLGFYGRFSDNLIGILSLCVLYFLIVNNVRTTKLTLSQNSSEKFEQASNNREAPRPSFKETWTARFAIPGLTTNKLINVFLVSVGVVVIISYLSIFNIWARIPGLPGVMKTKVFNTIAGTLEGLSVFLSVVLCLIVGRILMAKLKNQKSKIGNFINYFLFILCILLLLLIDFWPAWIVLLVTMLLVLGFAFWSRLFREKVNVLLIPILLIIISIIGLSSDIRYPISKISPSFVNIPREVNLNYSVANHIVWESIKKYPLFGSGIGTFYHNFCLFKPKEFNQSLVWNIRFDKAPNHIMEMISTTGILGILSYLGIIGMLILLAIVGLKRLKKEPNYIKENSSYFLPVFLTWFSLFVAQFVYIQNSTLGFCFFLFMGLSLVELRKIIKIKSRIKFSFSKWPELGLIAGTVLIVIAIVVVGLFYMGGRFYLAEAKVIKIWKTQEENIKNLEKIINLNPYRSNYRIFLSRGYLSWVLNEVQKKKEEQNVGLIRGYISSSIAQGKKATEISPNFVNTWENLGVIYRDLRLLTQGADKWAVESFEKALELEPNNPVLYAEIGKIYAVKAVPKAEDFQENITKAIEKFNKAVELKSDYLDPKIQLALAEEKRGNIEKAIKRLEEILVGQPLRDPLQIEALFQLGRLYFNSGKTDASINIFNGIIRLVPNHLNSHYALAIAYEKKKMFDKAVKELETVLKLSPNNEVVKKRLENLKKKMEEEGMSTEEGINTETSTSTR